MAVLLKSRPVAGRESWKMRNKPETIMGHCHLFPGGLGASRRDEFGIPGTSEHLERFMKACGFDRAQVLAPHESPANDRVVARVESGTDGLEWLLDQKHVGPDALALLLPAATIRPQLPDAVQRLEKARASGVRMLKFHPLIMQSDPLLPECAPFFKSAAEARMPMVYHTGSGSWGWTDEGGRPETCRELAKRYPDLIILLAHCGTFGGADGFQAALAACEKYPNLYLETSAALLPVGADLWKEALDRVGPRRVIYGNDYPWATRQRIEQQMAFIDLLGLDAEGKTRILGQNLKELYRAAGPTQSGQVRI